MRAMRSVTAVGCVAALAACGGSDGGTGGIMSANNFSDFQALQSQFLTAGPTTPSQMPVNASATYSGFANLGVDPGATNIMQSAAVGTLTLTADFASGAGTLSGSVGNFQYFDQTPVAGSVTLSNGVIAGSDVVSGEADGTVAGRVLDLTFDGGFAGDTAGIVFLYFDGTSTAGADVQNTGGVGIGLLP